MARPRRFLTWHVSDGIRYGYQEGGLPNLSDQKFAPAPTIGFAEVKRRQMLGAYLLSSGVGTTTLRKRPTPSSRRTTTPRMSSDTILSLTRLAAPPF